MVKFVPLVIALIVLVAVVSWPRSELLSNDYINQALTASGEIDKSATKGVWFNEEVTVPVDELAQAVLTPPTTAVLGTNNEEKWIEVDLTNQRVLAHEGNRTVYEFAVSTGLPWMPTITGEFRLWAKVRAQRMSGGDVAAGTFYDLPNVPFVQYFHKGYSFHGAYWHNDFGKPRSHGCINMRIADAEQLYYWTNPALASGQNSNYKIKPQESTRVVVYGTTPPA